MSEALRRLATITLPLCAGCPRPYACCSRYECELARETAIALGFGDVPFDEGARLPYLGDAGCRLPPEARPRCAVHLCGDGRRRIADTPAIALEFAHLRTSVAEAG